MSLTFFTPPVAIADELLLANGDRLTGTVERLTDGKLTFKTAHGDLEVPWVEVTAIRTDAPRLVTAGPPPARLMTIDTGAGMPPMAEIVEIQPPPPPVRWTGGAGAGLLASGGNTEVDSLRVDGALEARTLRDRYSASAVLNRAEDGGSESSRNWTATLGYDRFVSRRVFLESSASLTYDRFKDLDLRTALGAGVGYQVWDTPAAIVSVNGGAGYVRENFGTAADDSYAALREAAKLDLFFAAKRVQAFHHHDTYIGVTGEENLFLKMQNGVRLAVAQGFVTTIQVDVDYDRTPAPGRVSTDRTVSMTLGYRF